MSCFHKSLNYSIKIQQILTECDLNKNRHQRAATFKARGLGKIIDP